MAQGFHYRPGNPSAICQTCGAYSKAHCASKTCPWFWCPRCDTYGKPGAQWIPVTPTLPVEDINTEDET